MLARSTLLATCGVFFPVRFLGAVHMLGRQARDADADKFISYFSSFFSHFFVHGAQNKRANAADVKLIGWPSPPPFPEMLNSGGEGGRDCTLTLLALVI